MTNKINSEKGPHRFNSKCNRNMNRDKLNEKKNIRKRKRRQTKQIQYSFFNYYLTQVFGNCCIIIIIGVLACIIAANSRKIQRHSILNV